MNGAEKAGWRPRRAIARAEKIVTRVERRFGPGHSLTLLARTNLADQLHAAGRTGEAIAMLEQIAADSERLLGPDHKNTLDARMRMAFGYQKAGDTAGAILDRFDMAPLYAAVGRTSEAIAAAEWGVTDRKRHFGPADPATIKARALLADLYQAAGRTG